MEKLPELSNLSSSSKDELIIAMWAEIERLRKLIEEQEKPAKTSENSSVPPSKGFKANKGKGKKKKGGERRAASVGRVGGGRRLHPSRHKTLTAMLSKCPGCDTPMLPSSQRLHSRYDRIELPPITPIVTRLNAIAVNVPNAGLAQWPKSPNRWRRAHRLGAA